MTFPDEKRPAADSAVLCRQLQRELSLLRQDEVDPEEPLLYEVYARQVRAECWRRVGAGDLTAPDELLACLGGTQSFVNAFLPEPGEPRAEAARLVHQLLVELALAARSLEPAHRRARLADRSRSATEREVLRVLFAERDHYLRRGEVHQKMRHGERQLSQVRIGQILVDLHHEGLLLRIHGTTRGNPSAAFYALSEAGVEICQELDLASPATEELPPLFSIPPQMTRDLLQSGALAAPSRGFARPSGQIVTFYSYRGGLGRSLAVAHAGSLLAAKQQGDRFLLIDMDLEAPGLNEYFDVPPGTAGFEGLLADYAAQPADERRAWLAKALEQPRYVVQARGLRNLFLLPSASTAAAGEAGGAASQLQAEVARARHLPDGRPGIPEDGFLADLRDALHKNYTRVLIDAPAGLSSTSYVSAVLLPDELVLCLRPNPGPVDNVRKVLANFLWRVHRPEERLLTTFVFTPFPLEARDLQPNRWLEERLMLGRPGAGQHIYRIVRLYHSKEVACGRDLLGEPRGGSNTNLLLRQGYEDLATLIGSSLAGSDLPPRIEREISQLVSAEAERTTREPASRPPTLTPARERLADVLAFSSGGHAHEAVEGLATIGRRRS